MFELGAGWEGLPAEGGGVRQVACFVSAHGFGHATRASAVMAAMLAQDPALHFHIFTEVPAWIFAESLPGSFTCHAVTVDVGLIQHTVWEENLPATVERLDTFLPFDPFLVRQWASWLRRLDCELVLCDIAPLGLAAARAAEVPSVLVENFTWDWIYAGYLKAEPRLGRHLAPLRAAYQLATYHLQTEPVCAPAADAALRLPPIGRQPRTPRAVTRAALGVDDAAALVLVTLGGASPRLDMSLPKESRSDIVYVMAGAAAALERDGQSVRLPHQSGFYHPDLIAASDAVIGKTGYSTMAEAYQLGVPFGYVHRPGFRETEVMAAFIEREGLGIEVPTGSFQAGTWGEYVAALLARPRRPPPPRSGAAEAAAFILSQM